MYYMINCYDIQILSFKPFFFQNVTDGTNLTVVRGRQDKG